MYLLQPISTLSCDRIFSHKGNGMEKHIGYVCMKSFFKNIRPISWRGVETSDLPKLSPWRELHIICVQSY